MLKTKKTNNIRHIGRSLLFLCLAPLGCCNDSTNDILGLNDWYGLSSDSSMWSPRKLQLDDGITGFTGDLECPAADFSVQIDPSENLENYYGDSIAIYNGLIAVGSQFLSTSPGQVFLFNTTKDSAGLFTWGTPLILNNTVTTDLYFGSSVDIWEDIVVVGSYIGDNGGSVFIYVLGNDLTFSLMQTISDGNAPQDFFGYDVAIQDNKIVVGAPFYDVNDVTNAGAAYVYRLNGDTETGNWVQEEFLTDPSGVAFDAFGTSVDIDNNTIVIGSPYTGTYKGSIHIFEFTNENNWQLAKTIEDPNGADNLQFGRSVAIAGDYVVSSSRSTLASGFASVYNKTDSGWSYVTNLTDSALAAGDKRYKNSVGISEDGIIVVGSPYDDVNNNIDAGSISIFWNKDFVWEKITKMSEPAGQAKDYFGSAVDIQGKQIAIGGYGSGVNNGKAHTTSCFETLFTITNIFNLTLPTSFQFESSFSFDFTIEAANDQPDDGTVTLLAFDCQTPINTTDNAVSVTSNFTTTDDSSKISVTLELDDANFKNSSLVSGNETKGSVDFCLQVDVIENDVSSRGAATARGAGLPLLKSRMLAAQVVAREFAKFQIQYEATQVGVVVYSFNTNDPSIPDAVLDYAFEVDTCLCDASNICQTSTSTYDLNSRARVCITPRDNNAYVANFAMSLTNSATGFVYTPVDFGTGVYNPDAITQVSNDGTITAVSVFLVSSLFDSSNTNIVVNGNVYLTFIDTSKSLTFTPFQLNISLNPVDTRAGCFFPIAFVQAVGDLMTYILGD